MTLNAPTTGPDPTWEEVYGADYPWNWLTAGELPDVPVLDNGLVRVRYDWGVTPGFRVDVWNGTAYVEQGKMLVYRMGDTSGYCDTWVSGGLHTENGYTPERATVSVVLARAADAYSHERVFITVRRGQMGALFECYPALTSAGAQADVAFRWCPAPTLGAQDVNDSVLKIDSLGATPLPNWTPGAAGSGVLIATAGSGSSVLPSANVGAGSFATSENFVALLRCPTAYNVIGAYQAVLVPTQAANTLSATGNDTAGYGIAANWVSLRSQNAAGYVQAGLSFAAAQPQQILEAEAMVGGTGTSSTADAAASGGTAMTATRTTDANKHVSQVTWPNGFQAVYRIFARVKVSANTGSFYAKTGATTGATVTTASTSYVWLDLGEVVANNTSLEIHAWIAAGGTVSVDRIEAVLVQDRTRSGAIYSGARDAGQAALYDSRQLGAITVR